VWNCREARKINKEVTEKNKEVTGRRDKEKEGREGGSKRGRSSVTSVPGVRCDTHRTELSQLTTYNSVRGWRLKTGKLEGEMQTNAGGDDNEARAVAERAIGER
jgi:hypothetical protein